jgi:tetratricopeptide (TPR) repeat protein
MAAPRFSPAARLLAALAIVYATVAVLGVWLGPSLRFAAARLPGYFRASIASPEHRDWEDEAATLVEERRDLDRAQRLLERALAVEPNASTHFLLGEVLRARGSAAEALQQYRASIALDPAKAEPYLRTAELLLDARDAAAATRVLDEASAALQRAIALQRPRPDPTVRDVFNDRASDVFEDLSADLRSVDDAARRIRSRVD